MAGRKRRFNRGSLARVCAAIVIPGGVFVLAAALEPPGGVATGRWYSIVPPVTAVVLAFLTRRVFVSLGLGFLVGAFLLHVPAGPSDPANWLAGAQNAASTVEDILRDPGNLQIFAFMPAVFIMVEVMLASGGFAGVVQWLLRWVRGSRSAQAATGLLGVLCFIDDYVSAIIVGSTMQPITDRFGVSRQKLAFLVDATSAPISGLAVISTWIAYEVGLFESVSAQLGMGHSGYSMFFDALAYRFYCLLMLAFVFLQIGLGREFGPMRRAEDAAADSLQSRLAADEAGPTAAPHGRAAYALVPLGGFVLFHLTGLWFDGGGWALLRDGGSVASWDYWRQVIGASKHTRTILDCAAGFGLLLALACLWWSRCWKWRLVWGCMARGLKRALMPIMILTLAWSLKTCCDGLGAGGFLVSVLGGRVAPGFFPPLVFLTGCIISFATGTSYGTMAILIPTAVPVAYSLDGGTYGLTTMITLGAVLDGAIFGDHCSPISDTTILSATASGCGLMDHTRTQLPYGLLVAATALMFGYLPAARGLPSMAGLGLAVCVILGFFLVLRRLQNRQVG